MCDRKLRSNTRKDYARMADLDGDLVEDQEPGFSDYENNNKDGGEIINNEFVLSDQDSDVDSNAAESSDEDILSAKEQLRVLKSKQKELAKEAKLSKIAEETKNVRRSIEKLSATSAGKKKSRKNVNIASLRKMDDVVANVDRLMDEKLKIYRLNSSESEDGVNDQPFERSVSRSRRGVNKSSEKEDSRARGGGKAGKSKNVNSFVDFPQEWPDSHLNVHFGSRKKEYSELSMAEFCAGYATILEFTGGIEKAHRISHLKDLMYLSSKFTWKSILNYHGACLTELERGHLKWGDSFLSLQSTILAGSALLSQNGGPSGRSMSSGGSNSSKSDATLFCRNYQRGNCQQSRDHYGYFYGENRLLKHICATCWQKDRKVSNHPETSDECPRKEG